MLHHNNISRQVGLKAIFFIQMLSMIGFSMVFSLLVLYCTRVLNLSDTGAYAISSAFNALCFAVPLLGGYLSENYLGYRFAAILAMALSLVGLFILALDNIRALFWGLAFFAIGIGMLVPSIYVLLGRLYTPSDQTRYSGFTYAYIGMNIGAFIATSLSGYIANNIGYYFAYLIGAIATFFALCVFVLYQRVFRHSQHFQEYSEQKQIILKLRLVGVGFVFIAIVIAAFLLNSPGMCNIVLISAGLFSFLLMANLIRREPSHYYKSRMKVYLSLIILAVVLWSLYMLAPTALTLFIQRNVDRHVLGYFIPTASYAALNPLFIIALGPLISIFWKYSSTNNRFGISLPIKFALGSVLMGAGYLAIYLGIHWQNAAGFISSAWVIGSYFLQTLGELLVGPVGYAMVGDLIPIRYEGLMLGVWQMSTGLGSAISYYLSSYAEGNESFYNPLVTDASYGHAFLLYGIAAISTGLIICLLSGKFSKMLAVKR